MNKVKAKLTNSESNSYGAKHRAFISSDLTRFQQQGTKSGRYVCHIVSDAPRKLLGTMGPFFRASKETIVRQRSLPLSATCSVIKV